MQTNDCYSKQMNKRSEFNETVLSNHSRLEFRAVETADIDACANIYSNAWNVALPAHPRVVKVKEFLEQTKKDRTTVAVHAGRIVGFVSVSVFEAECFVHLLFVDPSAQGLGIGTAPLSFVERNSGSHTMSLKCQCENVDALNFYSRIGFVEGDEAGANEYGKWVLLIRQRVINL